MRQSKYHESRSVAYFISRTLTKYYLGWWNICYIKLDNILWHIFKLCGIFSGDQSLSLCGALYWNALISYCVISSPCKLTSLIQSQQNWLIPQILLINVRKATQETLKLFQQKSFPASPQIQDVIMLIEHSN